MSLRTFASGRLDLESGDLVWEDGGFTRDDGRTPVLLRLLSQRGSYPDDVEFGSRLHELSNHKVPATAAKEVEPMVIEALQPMLDDGRLLAVTVPAIDILAAGIAFHLSVTLNDDRRYRLRVFQPVGTA